MVEISSAFRLSSLAVELLRDAPWENYVALGDSITAGFGDPVPGYPDGGFATMLTEALRAVRPDLRHSNLAREHLIARRIRKRQLGRALALEPDLVTVFAGANDVLDPGFDPRAIESELETMIATLAASGATVATFTMFDLHPAGLVPADVPRIYPERFEALAALTRAVAQRHDVVFVDFARHPVSADRRIYSTDLRHANMRGHAVIAEHLLRALARRVSAAAAAR
jgi:lysophospholipase L1-like esterase